MLEHVSGLHHGLLSNKVPLYDYNTFSLSIHQLMDILGCFHFLAIMNNATMNMCVPASMWMYIFISLRLYP